MQKHEIIEVSGTKSQLATIHKGLPSLLIEGWYAYVAYVDASEPEAINSSVSPEADIELSAKVYATIIAHQVVATEDLFSDDESTVSAKLQLQIEKIVNFLNPPEGEKVTKAQAEAVKACEGVELTVDGGLTVVEPLPAAEEQLPTTSRQTTHRDANLINIDLANAKVVLQSRNGKKIEAIIPETERSLFRGAMARSHGNYVISEEPSAGGSGKRACLVEAPFFSDKKLFIED